MKKYLITISFILIGFLTFGQNSIQIADQSVVPNQSFYIEIEVNNADEFTALQLDLNIPDAFILAEGSFELNTNRINGHQIQSSVLPNGNLRIIAYSASNMSFTGNSGWLARFQLTAGTIPGHFIFNPQNAVLGNKEGQNILTNLTSGTVSIIAPDINLTTNQLDFGKTAVSQNTSRNFSIQNIGTKELSVSAISISHDQFTASRQTPFTIAAGESTSVNITFTPNWKGEFDFPIQISSNDPDEAQKTIDVMASAYTINEIHVGSMFAYSGNQAELKISINNMEAFCGFQFELNLPTPLTYISGSADFLGRNTNHQISAQQLANNKLRIIAFSADNSNFTGNDGEIVSLQFEVEGTGGNYSIPVQNGIIGLADGSNILSAQYAGSLEVAAADISCQNSLNFGRVSSLESKSMDFQINNFGSDELSISQLVFSDPSFTTTQTLPLSIPVNQNQNISVKYQNTSEGNHNGTMKIFSNDPDENPLVVQLSGETFISNYLSIPDQTFSYNEDIDVEIWVENHEAFVALQFDLSYPADFFSYRESELTNRLPDHQIMITENQNGTLKVIVYSMNQTPVQGQDGAVLTLKFDKDQLIGGIHNFNLSNAILGNAASENILEESINGQITVLEQPNLEASPTSRNVSKDAGSTTYDITSNIDWTATETTDWFSIDQNSGNGDATLTLTYSANPTIQERSGTITLSGTGVNDVVLTVNQAEGDAVLETAPTSRNVGKDAGTTTFDITSNIQWTATENSDWFAIDKTNGNGDATLTVSYLENTTIMQRDATITLAGNGVSDVVLTINQAEGDPILQADPTSRNVGKDSGTTTFNITSNIDWTATENSEWFSIDKNSENGNATLTVTYSANPAIQQRSGTITLSGNGVSDIVLTVNQVEGDAVLEADPSSRNVSKDAGSTTFDITSNIDWTATENTDWFSIDKNSGNGNAILTITYSANPTIQERSGSITLTGNGVSDIVLTVNQAEDDAVLEADPSSRNVSKDAGSTTFDITSNIDWTATENTDWFSIDKNSGNGNATLTLTYSANPTIQQRSGSITLSGNGVSDVVLTVNQAEGDAVLEAQPSSRNVGAEAGTTTFDITTNIDWAVTENTNWFSVDPMSGSRNTTITVTYEQNLTAYHRSGEISLSGNNVPNVLLEIEQYCSIPIQPETIFGSQSIPVTIGLEHEYYINKILNASSYHWSTPEGWNIIRTQGDTSIFVSPTENAANSGNICVYASNEAGDGNAKCLEVELEQVGIEDYALNKYIQVFPNPTKGIIHIRFGDIKENLFIRLIGLNGYQIYDSKIPEHFTVNEFDIDLSLLKSGYYFILFINQKGEVRGKKKIIKL